MVSVVSSSVQLETHCGPWQSQCCRDGTANTTELHGLALLENSQCSWSKQQHLHSRTGSYWDIRTQTPCFSYSGARPWDGGAVGSCG